MNNVNGFYNTQFGKDDSQWICPNVTQINLINQETIYNKFKFQILKAQINTCSLAKENDQKNGIVSYADKDGEQDCDTSFVADDYLSR